MPLADGRFADIAKALPAGFGGMATPALFLGERSRTADRDKLLQAKQMLDEGVDPERIRRATGWFQDHGIWNYEVDDRQFRQTRPLPPAPPGASLFGGPTVNFFDHFAHPEVQNAYPDMALRMRASDPTVTSEGSLGAYDMDAPPGSDAYRLIRLGQQRPGVSTPLHELQHAIDTQEGWPERRPDLFNNIEERPDYVYEDDPLERRAFLVERRRLWNERQRLNASPIQMLRRKPANR